MSFLSSAKEKRNTVNLLQCRTIYHFPLLFKLNVVVKFISRFFYDKLRDKSSFTQYSSLHSKQVLPVGERKFPYFLKYSLSRSMAINSSIIPLKGKERTKDFSTILTDC